MPYLYRAALHARVSGTMDPFLLRGISGNMVIIGFIIMADFRDPKM